jgi:hypothetical protein
MAKGIAAATPLAVNPRKDLPFFLAADLRVIAVEPTRPRVRTVRDRELISVRNSFLLFLMPIASEKMVGSVEEFFVACIRSDPRNPAEYP